MGAREVFKAAALGTAFYLGAATYGGSLVPNSMQFCAKRIGRMDGRDNGG
jgi:hypothetical protein